MANVSSYTLVDTYIVRAGEKGLEPIVAKVVQIALSSQGGTTNLIPASVLGFRKILWSTSALKTDNSKIYPTGPDLTGANLLTNDVATNAAALTIGDISVTVQVTVVGYPTDTVS